MDEPDSVRKLASLVAIGLVMAASLWLHPPSRPAPASTVLHARSIALPLAPVSGVRSGSYPVLTPSRPRSEQGQNGVRTGSEYEYGATQVVGTNEAQELRTLLPSRSMAVVGAPPAVASVSLTDGRRGPVRRALGVAGRETAGAFRTAGDAVRNLF